MNAAGPFRIEAVSDPSVAAAPLAALHERCFSDSPQETWSQSAIAALLAAPKTLGLVALAPDGDALGFIIGRVAGDDNEVLTLCVDAPTRRLGVGAALVVALWEALDRRRLVLEVAVTNRAARMLYRRLGFTQIGRRPGYYRGGPMPVDALVLAAENPGRNRRLLQ